MSTSLDVMLMSEKICPTCGKIFYVSTVDDWAYKFDGKQYCKWTCLTAAKRQAEQKKRSQHQYLCRDCLFYENGFCKNPNKPAVNARRPYTKACAKFERREA